MTPYISAELCSCRSGEFRIDFSAVGDHKITWEISRHQHLVLLARAWVFSGNDRFAQEAVLQWRHWIASNPFPLGINWTSTLEVAFRLLSWIWMDHILAGSAHDTEDFRRDLEHAIGRSAWYIRRYLSTYFAPNTHLLGEALAMFAAGLLYPQFRDSDDWVAEGWTVLREQARHQVRADGFHFEQSVYYHVYALDMFLHARILAERSGLDPSELDTTIQRMADALSSVSRGGVPPRFGDDDGGRLFDSSRNQMIHLLDPLSTAVALCQNPVWKRLCGGLREETHWLLGEAGARRFDASHVAPPDSEATLFRESGHACMPQEGALLVADVGPHGWGHGGHGHADALSLQLMKAGEALLTDPGTCAYPAATPERNRFRGTAAHSTLEIDGTGQAEPTGSFRWKRMPSVAVERWHGGSPVTLLIAQHDGYRRLSDPVIHQRSIVSLNGSGWFVRDLARARAHHQYRLHWQLPPDAEAFMVEDGFRVHFPSSRRLDVVAAADRAWAWSKAAAEWSPAYGASLPSTELVLAGSHDGVVEVGTVLDLGHDRPRLTVVLRSDAVSVYDWSDNEGRRRLWLSNQEGMWEADGVRSDAAFAMLAITPAGEVSTFGFAGGRALLVSGVTVLESSEVLGWFQWPGPAEANLKTWNPNRLLGLFRDAAVTTHPGA